MGVYIKGINMPKICELCPFWVMRTDGRWCRTLHKIIDISKDRADDCPLIEVDDDVWENEKYKLIRMTNEARINKAMAERRADGDI